MSMSNYKKIFFQLTFFGFFWFMAKRLYQWAGGAIIAYLLFRVILFTPVFLLQTPAVSLPMTPLEYFYFTAVVLLFKPGMLGWELFGWFCFNGAISFIFVRNRALRGELMLCEDKNDMGILAVAFALTLFAHPIMRVLCMDLRDYLNEGENNADLAHYISFEVTLLLLMSSSFLVMLFYKYWRKKSKTQGSWNIAEQ